MIAFVLCCCMISCIKDEAPNNECDIESAWVEVILRDGRDAQREHQFDRDEHHVCRALDVDGAETDPGELYDYRQS